MEDIYLTHWGIKGMKWGVRRYQNKDGSLTPAGKKRYNDDNIAAAEKRVNQAKNALKKANSTGDINKISDASKKLQRAKEDLSDEKLRGKMYAQKKKSKHQLKLEAKYEKEGLTKDEAELAAYKRVRAEKIFVAAAGLSVAALVGYSAYKNYEQTVDKLIKPDTLLQNISTNSNKGVEDAFYSAVNSADKTKYRGMYGFALGQTGEDVYRTTIKVGSEGLKVASPRNATKVLSDIAGQDPGFRKGMVESLKEVRNLFPHSSQRTTIDSAVQSLNEGKVTNKVYEAFNLNLVNHNPNNQKLIDKFYDTMKSRGYDAIKDINDSKYSGYNTKNPLIVFNGGKKTAVSSITKLGESAINNDMFKSGIMLVSEQFGKIGAVAAGAYSAYKVYDLLRKTSSKGDRQVVRQYREQHPNSKLSDKEILRMMEDENSV